MVLARRQLFVNVPSSFISWRYLTPFVTMEFPIKFDTVTSEWSIVCIEGSQVIIFKNIVFLSLEFDFVLSISAYTDEMPPEFSLFAKVSVLWFLVFKRLSAEFLKMAL